MTWCKTDYVFYNDDVWKVLNDDSKRGYRIKICLLYSKGDIVPKRYKPVRWVKMEHCSPTTKEVVDLIRSV